MSALESSAALLRQQEEIAERYFEPKLRPLGLSVAQIEEMDVDGLNQALNAANDAIQNPDNFGALSLKFVANAGLIVAKVSQEGQLQVGVLPILLERKKLILDRLREFESTDHLVTIRAAIEGVEDNETRRSVEAVLSKVQTERERLLEERIKTERAQHAADLERAAQRLDIGAGRRGDPAVAGRIVKARDLAG
jgi:hypothetical protein